VSSGAQQPTAPPPRGEARDRILQVASERFAARGYADVSMQEIADAVGITKAALYYHFRSKEDLFAEVARRAINDFWAGIIALAESGRPLRETLQSIARFVRDSMTSVSMSLLEDVHRHLPPEVEQEIFTEHPTPEAALEGLFRRAIAAGEMRPMDVEPVTAMFVGMVMGLGQRGHTRRQPKPDEDELLVDVLLRGIGTERTGAVPDTDQDSERSSR